VDKLLIPFSDQPWDRLGIGRTTFYELVNTGRISTVHIGISTVHIGRRRLVHADELERFARDLVAEQRDAAC